MIETKSIPQVALECLHKDHVDVLLMLNRLLNDLAGQASAAALTQQFDTLVEHCANHFFCEEKQMSSYRYPKLAAHQAEHQRIVADLAAMQQRWRQEHDRQQLSGYLESNFTPWLVDHIQRFDVEGTQFIFDAGGR